MNLFNSKHLCLRLNRQREFLRRLGPRLPRKKAVGPWLQQTTGEIGRFLPSLPSPHRCHVLSVDYIPITMPIVARLKRDCPTAALAKSQSLLALKMSKFSNLILTHDSIHNQFLEIGRQGCFERLIFLF